MKKILFIILLIILISTLLIFITTFNSNKSKIIRANIIYGTSKKCNKIETMTTDIRPRKCHLCLQNFQGSSSEIICDNCSQITNRCTVCGKINSNQKGLNYAN